MGASRFRSGGSLWILGLAAGLLFVWTQQEHSVPAEEPRHVELSNADLSPEAPQPPLPEVDMLISGRTYRVEVASTPVQEQKGLMFRTQLPAGHGMLFRFFPPRAVNFWMKNTLLPLDMVFIRHNAVVNIAQNVPPCKQARCPSYPSVVAVDMVVELPAGTTQRDGIHIGDPVAMEQPETATVPVPVAQPADPLPSPAPSQPER